jgi:hypothetical protein
MGMGVILEWEIEVIEGFPMWVSLTSPHVCSERSRWSKLVIL